MSIVQHMAEDAGTIGNSTASAAVVGVSLYGFSLPDVAAAITGLYFLVATVFLVVKFRAWLEDRRCSSKD